MVDFFVMHDRIYNRGGILPLLYNLEVFFYGIQNF